jgi:hypothetical protein
MIVFTQQLKFVWYSLYCGTVARMDKKNEVGFDYNDIDRPRLFQVGRKFVGCLYALLFLN